MKISYNWLKQFLKIDWDAEKIAALLTDLGLEVEGIETYESIKGGLKGIVVGEVLTCDSHPNADKLKLTTVNVGQDNVLKIVCGAPNVASGQKVPVATIGTTLYTEKGESFIIKKSKIRGEESHGMICAEDELGLGESHDGILVLDDDAVPGTSLSDIFDVEHDVIFDIGLTPNRADAMSHWGVARDLRVGLLQQQENLELITPSVSTFSADNRTLKVNVSVEDKSLVPRYCGVTISGITVKPSPSWLQNRLRAIGLSPINNIVDATNYVLHELGQPLHAFDASKISGNTIEVKTLPEGTKFVTLDGVERKLHKDDIMICDANNPMCLAGIFGGMHSGVTEHTKSIFLESAYFNPVSIRKSAKRHGLSTDASFRFERGIDPNACKYALKRAALLILEISGGEITSDIIDLYPDKIEGFDITISFENINNLIGKQIPRDVVKNILTSLDIKISSVTETTLGLTVPPYRNDVKREADIIEEILRVYGYNNVEPSEIFNISVSKTSRLEDHKVQDIVANQLVSQGFFEILTNSLTSPSYTELNKDFKKEQNVAILNPLSNELSVLRQSMLFSGLETVVYNLNRQQSNLKCFEFGKTYVNLSSSQKEYKHLSLFVTGNETKESWYNAQKKASFFSIKGVVASIFDHLGISYEEMPSEKRQFFEGVDVRYKDLDLACYGVVNATITKHFGISQDVLFADFNWDNILHLITRHKPVVYKPISKYPEVRRDFALLIDKKVTFRAIYDIAQQTEKRLLRDINLFDVYEGGKLPEGKKSYAVSFILQDENKTLTDKQVDKIMSKLEHNFKTQLGAELR